MHNKPNQTNVQFQPGNESGLFLQLPGPTPDRQLLP